MTARIISNAAPWRFEIRFRWPDRTVYRERRLASVASKSGALREANDRETHLRERGKGALTPAPEAKEAPTLAEFAPRFIDGYARAERQKPSGIDSKETIIRLHLVPHLGAKRLDAIRDEDVQRLKVALARLQPKTINNVLVVLSRMLRVAVDWSEIQAMPCRLRLLKAPGGKAPSFYEFEDYGRLVEAATEVDPRARLIVLLGGDAGLRRGEMIGLRWCDVDFARGQLSVAQSVWHGEANAPKSNKPRIVPMTDALAGALKAHRHLRGERVLYADNGRPPGVQTIQSWSAAAQRRASLPKTTGGVHVLRHTFCSHLAMRGAPPKAIQELAGHANLATTLRYMHLSPAARTSAIALLNDRGKGVATLDPIEQKA